MLSNIHAKATILLSCSQGVSSLQTGLFTAIGYGSLSTSKTHTAARDPMANPAVRTIAYIRVSSTDQADNGHSLAAQREKVELYAKLHGLDLVAVIDDAGV